MPKDNSQVCLTIFEKELRRIVSGEKTQEFRDSTEYYFNRFCKPHAGEIRNGLKYRAFRDDIKTLKLVSRNYYAVIEVTRIRHVVFGDKLPINENFCKGDVAFCIDLGKIIDTNLHLGQ